MTTFDLCPAVMGDLIPCPGRGLEASRERVSGNHVHEVTASKEVQGELLSCGGGRKRFGWVNETDPLKSLHLH